MPTEEVRAQADAGPTDPALKLRTLSGLSWNLSAQVLFQVVSLGIAAILTRILTPRDFGLVAMTAVFTGFLNVLSKVGIAKSLINEPELTEAQRSSAFWVSLASGGAIALLTMAAAPLVAHFYREPQVTPIMIAIGALFVVSAFARVPEALLTRELRFRGLAVGKVAATLAGGALGIGAALAGLGVWSLVIYQAGVTLANTLIFWLLVPWRPRWQFSRSATRAMAGFAANLSGAQVFNYWTRNADNLLVGRYLGPVELGFYSRGYNLMLVPLIQFSEVIGAVMWPSLARIQHSPERVRSVVERAIGVLALALAPLSIGAFVLADQLLLVVLGPQWTPAVAVFRILALAGLLQSIASVGGWMFQSQGRADLLFRWQAVRGVLVVLGFVAGVMIGTIEAVALSFLLVTCLAFPFDLAIPGRLVALPLRAIAARIWPALACAAAMGGVVVAVRWLLPMEWPAWLRLLLEIAVGALFYGLVVHLFRLPAYQQARQIVLELAGRGDAARRGQPGSPAAAAPPAADESDPWN